MMPLLGDAAAQGLVWVGISIGRAMGAILRNTISTSQVKDPSDERGDVTV